ncbi:PREDICTED: interleukin-1 receptor-associated kinase 4-like [Thamnophis sirtalis]|uniref:Interleukin-1 receptor-associated kinase 4 n=1 Tax=Thamnophis sirtalis TaxID=35019 RepID=A0A6I9Z4L7_9SAUR|nr:PREDICTED: interleukin-1 receptor-associated kinase 4-like [Thamnophis sirtalis]
MTNSITPSTYVRSLGYGMMRQLADFIDPQEGWKKLAADITDLSGAKRYNQMQMRRFEALKQVGKSPTCELLYDWGTLNCTVRDLVDLLIRNQFLAPASLLIPGNFDLHFIFHTIYIFSINHIYIFILLQLADISIEDLKKQFEQEIKIMGKCQHENLVELLGFSNDFNQPCLVYDYMPNGSLLDRLACLDNSPPIPWDTRCNIAFGTSNGITFLHENNHIHRDVKSANILLTETFVPKLSDFGLARASVRFTHTILTDRIVGTAAYMAPEALRGEITPKSDVFSFGVVLLEIITGLSPMDENRDPQLLLSIKEEIEDEEKTIEDYVDKKISNWNITSIEHMYSIAAPCLHEKKNRRPDIERVPILNVMQHTHVCMYVCMYVCMCVCISSFPKTKTLTYIGRHQVLFLGRGMLSTDSPHLASFSLSEAFRNSCQTWKPSDSVTHVETMFYLS